MLKFVCDRCKREQKFDQMEWVEGACLEETLDVVHGGWQIVFDRLLCGECIETAMEFIDTAPTKKAA